MDNPIGERNEAFEISDAVYDALDNVVITDENIKFFIWVLETTADPNVRNLLSLKIAETKNPLLVESLVRLLRSPQTQNCRGNLLSALSEYDYAPYVDLLLDLLFTDNYEVRERCGYMLFKISDRLTDPEKRKISQTVSAAIEDCKDRTELYQAVIDEMAL